MASRLRRAFHEDDFVRWGALFPTDLASTLSPGPSFTPSNVARTVFRIAGSGRCRHTGGVGRAATVPDTRTRRHHSAAVRSRAPGPARAAEGGARGGNPGV